MYQQDWPSLIGPTKCAKTFFIALPDDDNFYANDVKFRPSEISKLKSELLYNWPTLVSALHDERAFCDRQHANPSMRYTKQQRSKEI